jgi:hypothetical protein
MTSRRERNVFKILTPGHETEALSSVGLKLRQFRSLIVDVVFTKGAS